MGRYDDPKWSDESAPAAPRNRYDDPKYAAPDITRIDKFTRGLRDPIDAGAQLLTHILPASVVSAGDRLNNWIADNTGLVGRLPEGGVDQQVRDAEQQYRAARTARGETGIDGYRTIGNILNPVNIAAMSRIPQAATLAGRIGVGAISGATSGALQPVGDGDFASQKGNQMASGAAIGGFIPAAAGGLARVIDRKSTRLNSSH